MSTGMGAGIVGVHLGSYLSSGVVTSGALPVRRSQGSRRLPAATLPARLPGSNRALRDLLPPDVMIVGSEVPAMRIIEEWRRGSWVGISNPVPQAEAQAALRLLRWDRPWRAYRVSPAKSAA